MAESFADQMVHNLAEVAQQYHRLIILAALPGSGKTTALQIVHERTGAPMINVSLELSLRLLDLTARQRVLQLPRLLDDIVKSVESDVILLDNIEILFDVSLKQDPLRLLQRLARNNTLIVAWGGTADENYLTYATTDHPEYWRYPRQDFLVIHPEPAH